MRLPPPSMPIAHATSRELYLRLLGHVRPYWGAFLVAIVTLVLTAATEPRDLWRAWEATRQ